MSQRARLVFGRWLVSALLAVASGSAAGASFDFLYIEANEGNASGGHAALRFGDRVYHFQHVEPGLLRLYRDDFAAFRFAYADQQNRTLHGHRIEVADAYYQALQETFDSRLAQQNRELSVLRELQEDADLSRDLYDSEQVPQLRLRALGYFLEEYRAAPIPAAGEGGDSPELATLRTMALQKYGADFLAQKRRTLWQELSTLAPDDSAQASASVPPAGSLTFAQHYKNRLLNLAALDLLLAGKSPRADALLTLSGAHYRLSEAQQTALRRYRDQTRADLLRLLNSERPDWGYPLLVGMARLHALQQSLAGGYLTVLDRRAADADPYAPAVDLPAALQYSRQLLGAANAQLAAAQALDERGYATIEHGANAVFALERAEREQQAAALPRFSNTPDKSAPADWPRPPLPAATAEAYRTGAAARLADYRQQLFERYAYHLVQRNCVTEIFRLLNATAAAQASATVDASDLATLSEQALGAYLDSEFPHPIPFAAFDRVGERYRTVASYQLPAYRDRQIRERYRTAPDWWVDLQESNSLTSSLYRWQGSDAAFVFFTQDAVWPRPLQGGFNLAAAALETGFGLLSWPWDAGQHVAKGIKGWAVSLPELMFFNIRKGSFPQLLPGNSSRKNEQSN
ncbi:hypothetical protein NP603_12280 [Methylomonas sp. SURF-1]|uniref:DUF4105 domain-containing protein n=1 Tax=Methylomonas aurea TaxID=2952224 RepID=A0ABT1UID2_9GAMM|nr:hypothetical protein [Methylomonas sp. SURF-1]MCQ8181887.1 hypothetical protein [Methylomonas sp. SURF-1]